MHYPATAASFVEPCQPVFAIAVVSDYRKAVQPRPSVVAIVIQRVAPVVTPQSAVASATSVGRVVGDILGAVGDDRGCNGWYSTLRILDATQHIAMNRCCRPDLGRREDSPSEDGPAARV